MQQIPLTEDEFVAMVLARFLHKQRLDLMACALKRGDVARALELACKPD